MTHLALLLLQWTILSVMILSLAWLIDFRKIGSTFARRGLWTGSLLLILLLPGLGWIGSSAGIEWITFPGGDVIGSSNLPDPTTLSSAPLVEGKQDLEPTKQGTASPEEVFAFQPPKSITSEESRSSRLIDCLVLIWSAGCLFSMGKLLLGFAQVRRLFIRTRPACQELRSLLGEVCDEIGFRRPKIFVSSEINVPLSGGTFIPRIVFPTNWKSMFTREECRDFLIHECAHLENRDPILGHLQRLAQCLYWHNPLMLVLHRRLDALTEEMADRSVVQFGSPPVNYARSMVSLAAAATEPTPSLPGIRGMIRPRSSLENRIRFLLSEQALPLRPCPRSTRVLIPVSIFLIALFLLGCRLGEASKTNDDPQKAPLRVLYIESSPRWHYRYFKNALLTDSDFRVRCFLLSADRKFEQEHSRGEAALEALPSPEVSLRDEADIIVLGDITFEGLCQAAGASRKDEKMMIGAQFKTFVSDGGGLLFVAGEKNGAKALLLSPLGELMPIQKVAPGRHSSCTFSWTQVGKDFPGYSVSGNSEENERLWESLPKTTWVEPIESVKPGAVVLATGVEDGQSEPVTLLANQAVGRGRTLSFQVADSWRWRLESGDQPFDRFWKQTLFWVGNSSHAKE